MNYAHDGSDYIGRRHIRWGTASVSMSHGKLGSTFSVKFFECCIKPREHASTRTSNEAETGETQRTTLVQGYDPEALNEHLNSRVWIFGILVPRPNFR